MEEVDFLRSEGPQRWGGQMAIVAYSAMRQKRVLVHEKLADSNNVTVEEHSHASVDRTDPRLQYVNGVFRLTVRGSFPLPSCFDACKEHVAATHILYNGVDHYDALVEMPDPAGLPAAWPQPPPPQYVSMDAVPEVPWNAVIRANIVSFFNCVFVPAV